MAKGSAVRGGTAPSAVAPGVPTSVDVDPPAPATVLLTAVLVSGLVPLAVYHATAGGTDEPHVGLIAVMVLAGLRFSWVLGSPTRHLYELVIWVFTYVFLGMAPLVQLRLGVEPETASNIRHAYVPTATMIVLLGCLAIVAGSHVARNSVAAPGRGSSPHPPRTAVLAVLGLMLGTYYIAMLGTYYIAKVGMGGLFLSVVETSKLREEIWPDPALATFIYGAVSMSLLVAAIALIKLRREESHGLPHARILQWGTLAMLFLIANPVSSPRYIFGSIVFAVLAAFGLYGRIGRFRLVAVATLVGMVVVFPAADAFRYTTETGIRFEDPLLALSTSDFDGFAQLVNTAQYVDLEGRTGGLQLLGTLLFWVPRSEWPEKPLDTGVMLAEYKEYGFTNLSSPLWGEFYIDFGWIGLIVAMFLVGFLVRRLDIEAEAQLRERPSPALLSCILPFYSMIILRGSLLQSVAYVSVALLFVLFVRQRRGS